MSIAEKLVTATELIDEVYKAGQISRELFHPILYNIPIRDFQWDSVKFPDNYNFVLRLAKTPSTCNGLLFNASGVKTVTLICDDKSGFSSLSQAFRECSVELIDLRDFNLKIKNCPYFVYSANNLVTILGALDLSYCTNVNSAFADARAVENIEFAKDSIVLDMGFSYCEKLTHTSLMSILNGLRDLNINVDISGFQPDFASKNNDFAPGRYKIKEVSLDDPNSSNQYRFVNLTTENDYYIRVAQQDCGEKWEEILEGFMVGNYVEIDGALNQNGYYSFDYLRLVSNPDGATKTLTLGAKNLAKLTDEEKQIATNKGWVLK